MNAPERSSAFLLDEDAGEVKIVYTPDTKVGSFVFVGLRWKFLLFAEHEMTIARRLRTQEHFDSTRKTIRLEIF